MAQAAVLLPLDACRREALRWLTPWLRALFADRERRVAWSGGVLVAVSLGATLVAPLWMLALSPVALGVPHLLSDVRALVIRPGYWRSRAWLIACGAPIALVSLTGNCAVGFAGLLGAVGCASGPARRKVPVALLAGAGAAVWWRWPVASSLVLAHAHNLLAVLLWWLWRPRATGAHRAWLAMFVAALAALMLLPVEHLPWTSLAPQGLELDVELDWLVPGVSGAWGARLLLSFAFAQAVHYGVWLRLIPDEDRARPAVRSFGASFEALRRDFTGVGLALFGLAALGIAAWAVSDLGAARLGYFRLALFHGHLEWAALAVWWVSRSLPRPC